MNVSFYLKTHKKIMAVLNHCAEGREMLQETTGAQQLYNICDLIEVILYLFIIYLFIYLFLY